MIGQRLAKLRAGAWQAAVMRSGMLTALLLGVVLAGLMFAMRERGRGRLAQLKRELATKPVAKPVVIPKPGGQDPVVLQRSAMSGGTMPEFLTATLLPGRGMDLLQITAYLPDKGEVKLLASEPLEQAEKMLVGSGADEGGRGTLMLGGALEVPWANRLGGTAMPDGRGITTIWHGRALSLPGAAGGLLAPVASTTVKTSVMPDGGDLQAEYDAGSFDDAWPSKTTVRTTVLLSSRAIEIKVVAQNTGTEPEPMGIGWLPRFAIPSGDRGSAMLRLPNADRVELRKDHGQLPTGRVLPVTGTEYDFTGQHGAKLGTRGIDASFVNLKPGVLDNGPVVELRDPTSGYGLRLTALSPSIRSIAVHAPANEPWVSIDPGTNYDDPLGREWAKSEDTGMVVLQPGESMQWRVRLELFPLSAQPDSLF